MNNFTHLDLGSSEERGADARVTMFGGSSLIKTILSSSFGPKGMVKLLTNNSSVLISNDGATILKNLQVNNPVAKILIDAAVGQDWEEGDGTTSVALLTCCILEECEKLLRVKVHPVRIIKGLSIGMNICTHALDRIAVEPTEEELVKLASTTLGSKIVRSDLTKFSRMCVNAVKKIENSPLNMISIIKVPGRLEDSVLEDGMILNKDVVVNLKNPKVMVANTSLDTDKVKIFSAKAQVKGVNDLVEIEEAEKNRMREKIEKISESKIDCFVNRQLIYDFPLQLLRKSGIVPIEHANFDGVERLALLLGAKIVSTFDGVEDSLGTCEEIKNVQIGEKRMVKFVKQGSGACTIVLRGSSKEVLDEAERSIHDALCVLHRIKGKKIIFGGGSPEMQMANELISRQKEALGIDNTVLNALSEALKKFPYLLAENAGWNGEEIKGKINVLHLKGQSTFGVNTETGEVSCMKELGVIESLAVKKRVVKAAIETAQLILKCDAIVKCKPIERHRS